MIASLEHAVDRTLTVFDQLGSLWGPAVRPTLKALADASSGGR